MKRREKIFVVVLVVSFFFALPCFGQQYPSKPIKMYCTHGAGGDTDTIGRMLASIAEKKLGQPIIVENKPGGSGAVALSLLSSEKPDGYTIAMSGTAALERHPHVSQVTYDPRKDFTFIVNVTQYVSSVVVPTNKPWKTFKEVVEYARANPKKVKYSAGGPVEMGAIAMAYVGKKEGLQWDCVPYKSGADAVMAAVGQHVDFYAGGGAFALILKLIEAGKMRVVVADFGPKRIERLSNVPILKELGYDFELSPRMGVIAPAGISADVLKKLEIAFSEASQDQKMVDLLNQMSLPPDRMNSAEFTTAVLKSYEKTGMLIEQMGMKRK